MSDANDYKQSIKDAILDERSLVKATFSGRQRGQSIPWVKIAIRPVLVKNEKRLQFSCFDGQKDFTHNYSREEAGEQLDQLLELPFKNFHVATTSGDLQVNITKKGEAIVQRGKAASEQRTVDLAHNRQKNQMLPEGGSDQFLRAVGIMAEDGRIKAGMQSKYRQINEFLRIVEQTGVGQRDDRRPLQVVDFGCGNAYLTFATYHYLNAVRGLPTNLTGIDVKADLMRKHSELSQKLGWTNLQFEATRIEDFQPAAPPDIVLALHACDTATDDALAQGVKWQSGFIFSAPCCHHDLQEQLHRGGLPALFKPVFRHGILGERLGDILTDTFRALILRIMGYKTDVVEFIATEDTPKNLMIRAVKSVGPGDPRFVQEYLELKEFWRVTPYLEQLLAGELAPRLVSATR